MICALVLAAGLSRRMGAQKLLLPFGGGTLIGHVVDQVAASGVDGVYVVVGRAREAIAAALAGRRVHLILNPQPESEMLSSVRCGLKALSPECEAALIVPGDHPGVRAELIDRLIEAYRASGQPIVVPVHDGRRGHPLLFSMRFRDEILSRYDGLGLRGLLADHGDSVCEVEASDEGALLDVDVPEDYRQALALLEGRHR